MTSIREAFRRFFTPAQPLPAGMYHYMAAPTDAQNYRLHLRLEPDGNGLLIINAATILHLNQTAAEYAYHLVRRSTTEQVAKEISSRYRISAQRALEDYQDITERIETLIVTPDLDPETFLDFDRITPHSNLCAPYRLDCAITYQLPPGTDPEFAPSKNVTSELPTSGWQEILDKAWASGIMHIVFTGGEPTLRPDLPDLISHAEKNGQVTGLLTDGLRLLDKAYLQQLLLTGIDHIMILAAPDSPLFWEALENTLRADVYVAVHLTIHAGNVESAVQHLREFANKGVRAISLSITDAGLSEKLVEMRNIAAQLGLTLVWDLPVPYSAFNPVFLELQASQNSREEKSAVQAWLYLEPDGDTKFSQSSPQILGNFLNDSWETLKQSLQAS